MSCMSCMSRMSCIRDACYGRGVNYTRFWHMTLYSLVLSTIHEYFMNNRGACLIFARLAICPR